MLARMPVTTTSSSAVGGCASSAALTCAGSTAAVSPAAASSSAARAAALEFDSVWIDVFTMHSLIIIVMATPARSRAAFCISCEWILIGTRPLPRRVHTYSLRKRGCWHAGAAMQLLEPAVRNNATGQTWRPPAGARYKVRHCAAVRGRGYEANQSHRSVRDRPGSDHDPAHDDCSRPRRRCGR